jgi:hypothetical protein
MPTEKELDLALKSALENDPIFLRWFVSQTKFGECGAILQRCRADYPWGEHPFPVTDPATGKSTTITRQSETDVLLIIRDRDSRTLGIHVENKVGAGKFTDLQPEMYSYRAAHWVGNRKRGGYTDFETVLLAPEAFRQRNAAQAAFFGCFISHETLSKHIPVFRPHGAV